MLSPGQITLFPNFLILPLLYLPTQYLFFLLIILLFISNISNVILNRPWSTLPLQFLDCFISCTYLHSASVMVTCWILLSSKILKNKNIESHYLFSQQLPLLNFHSLCTYFLISKISLGLLFSPVFILASTSSWYQPIVELLNWRDVLTHLFQKPTDKYNNP